MLTTNVITIGSSKARFTMAGPGHIPKTPHPIPNIIEPKINFLSIFLWKLNLFSEK